MKWAGSRFALHAISIEFSLIRGINSHFSYSCVDFLWPIREFFSCVHLDGWDFTSFFFFLNMGSSKKDLEF